MSDQNLLPMTEGSPEIPQASSIILPLVVACGLFMENLDSTVINTAIPAMAISLGETPLSLNLAITSYLLSLAVFIPISGWMADRFGTRNVFCSAIFIFTLGSALCGFSSNLPELIATRILQGAGGAMMVPVGRLVLIRSFPKTQLLRATNYVTIPALIGPAVGPIFGGFITTYISWRWIFFINLPVGAVGIICAWRIMTNFRADTQPPFDWRGFALVGCGLACFQIGLEALGRHLLSFGPQLGILALATSCSFVYLKHSRGLRFPAVSLKPFGYRTFRIIMISGASMRIPIGANPYLVPLFLQLALGYSPLQSGLSTFLSAVGAIFMKPITVPLLRRYGFRRLLIGNSLLVGLSLVGFAFIGARTPGLLIAGYLLVGGFIRSLQFTCLNTLAYADIPVDLMSQATSVASVTQQLTMSLGVAFSASLLSLLSQGKPLGIADFHLVFLIMGCLAAATMLSFSVLTPQDGIEVSGNIPTGQARAR